jgi:hypothetical protein
MSINEQDYNVQRISGKLTKEFITANHYTHGCHNGPMGFGLYYSEQLIGVCAFATPCSENVRSSVFGKDYKDSVTELHRLFIFDGTPRNLETWFVSRALNMLKQEKPHINAVVSFADGSQGHFGFVYQALNAIYYGTSGKATFYRDMTGRLRHPRQNGVNITKETADTYGWVAEKRDAKYRYLFLLGTPLQKKRMRKLLQVKQLPYPKPEVVS